MKNINNIKKMSSRKRNNTCTIKSNQNEASPAHFNFR